MGMEARGKVHLVNATKQVSDKFRKREFVVEIADNPKYPQLVQFEITGDRTSQLDGINEGDEVRIEFSLRGREWRSPSGETKYFNSLDAWKVDVTKKGEERPAPIIGGGGDQSDIPFTTCDLASEPSPIARVLR